MCNLESPKQRTQPYHKNLRALPSAARVGAGGTSWRFLGFLPGSLLLLTFFSTADSGPLVSVVRVSALPLLLLRKFLLACARFPVRIPELPGQVLVLLAKLDRALHSSEILLAEQRNTRVELLSCGFSVMPRAWKAAVFRRRTTSACKYRIY